MTALTLVNGAYYKNKTEKTDNIHLIIDDSALGDATQFVNEYDEPINPLECEAATKEDYIKSKNLVTQECTKILGLTKGSYLKHNNHSFCFTFECMGFYNGEIQECHGWPLNEASVPINPVYCEAITKEFYELSNPKLLPSQHIVLPFRSGKSMSLPVPPQASAGLAITIMERLANKQDNQSKEVVMDFVSKVKDYFEEGKKLGHYTL